MTPSTPEQGTGSLVNFTSLRTIDVGAQIEKKNGLSYLSWAYAVDQLLQNDPAATWDYRFGIDPATQQPVPFVLIGSTAMVFCTVKAFGVERTAQLPVMNHKNQPIPNPDAFQVNTAMQRCLAKSIALHGIGLYIYAGEDVPAEVEKEAPPPAPVAKLTVAQIKAAKDAVSNCESVDQLREVFNGFDELTRTITMPLVAALKKQLVAKEAEPKAAHAD